MTDETTKQCNGKTKTIPINSVLTIKEEGVVVRMSLVNNKTLEVKFNTEKEKMMAMAIFVSRGTNPSQSRS